ncbi:hypothetical protein M0208_04115 [Sphingomonas sp. SUN019]|uniref:hypothetical protein n=1 Tax=Sphingomonas sp. SUN019 TaxID=2937788 RepID=UPI0021648C3D|nr:hypothetical protein [Sphingomonas sp. SUN019]UVO49737.1 hypothetical protein M0208_04115 [Sphingomonas sp. SUN019]
MRSMLRLTLVTTLMLMGCANVSALTYNPNSDVHCHALAVYFQRHAIGDLNRQGKIDPGIFSTIVVSEWYRAKWLEQADEQIEMTIVKPLYEKIGSDFEASKRAWVGCSDRATNNQAFESYARALTSKMKEDAWWKSLSR